MLKKVAQRILSFTLALTLFSMPFAAAVSNDIANHDEEIAPHSFTRTYDTYIGKNQSAWVIGDEPNTWAENGVLVECRNDNGSAVKYTIQEFTHSVWGGDKVVKEATYTLRTGQRFKFKLSNRSNHICLKAQFTNTLINGTIKTYVALNDYDLLA